MPSNKYITVGKTFYRMFCRELMTPNQRLLSDIEDRINGTH